MEKGGSEDEPPFLFREEKVYLKPDWLRSELPP
jgi:hypothetical protein